MSSPEKEKTIGNLTPSETKVLLLGILCQPPTKIDYEKLAQLAGLKRGSASVMWNRSRGKLERAFKDESTVLDTPTKAKKTPRPRKKATKKQAESDDDMDLAADPEDAIESGSPIEPEQTSDDNLPLVKSEPVADDDESAIKPEPAE